MVMAAVAMRQAFVGASLRMERQVPQLHAQTPLPQELGENAVLQEHQPIGMELHRHMAITEVIGRLEQGKGIRAAHLQDRFCSGHHLHQERSVFTAQHLTGLQRGTPRQLQQQIATAGAAAMPAQAGALISRQGQLQRCRHHRGVRGRQAFHQQGCGVLLHRERTSCAVGIAAPWRAPARHCVATATHRCRGALEHAAMSSTWSASANLRFSQRHGITRHQGGATAPLKLMRAFPQPSGHCELPLLHTAGGLVGGDRLQLEVALDQGSRALITSVAAQKVYGSVQRSRCHPEGRWAEQQLRIGLAAGSDLEWLPQELVLYADALYRQQLEVTLAADASFLSMEVVRLGRTAAGEGLGAGCWRSSLQIQRQAGHQTPPRWELVDRLQLGADGMASEHGMAGQPVFGSLVWAAPAALKPETLQGLISEAELIRATRD